MSLHSDFAPKKSRFRLDQNRTVELGESIRVYGMILSNRTGSAQVVEITDNNNFYFMDPISIQSTDSKVIPIKFLADKGLKFVSAGTTQVGVTVFHSHGGA